MLLTEVKDKITKDNFYLKYCCDNNYTIAPDGEDFARKYSLDYSKKVPTIVHADFEEYKKLCKFHYSDSKVVVRSGLIDIRSLLICSAEILNKTGYWGRYLERYNFDDKYFEIGVGS